MEDNQQIYHVLPDTPISVLRMFETSAQGINSFAAKIINDVHDGKTDALEVKVLCSTLEKLVDKIHQGTKEHQANEAFKYGEKPFLFRGAELHYTSVKTEYDYTQCNDTVWLELQNQMTELKAKIKQREEWLRTMAGAETVLDKSTGEVVTIYPPIKKTTMGVKCTIK